MVFSHLKIALVSKSKVASLKPTSPSFGHSDQFAESVTAGIMQTAMAAAVAASKYLHGGITVYNLGQKARHLHINPIHAESCNCVSSRVAQEMALNVCSLFASDWGIGITGYATIDPVMKNKHPFAHFSIASKGETIKTGLLKHDEGDPG